MGFIDGHLHSIYLSWHDLSLMVEEGIDAIVTLAYTPIPPSSSSSLRDHFEHLMFDKIRCGSIGLRAYIGVGIHPRNIPLNNNASTMDEYLKVVENYLGRANLLGEVGLESGSELEASILREQLLLAKKADKPVIIHTPKTNKIGILEKTIRIIDDVGLSDNRVLLDHLTPSPRIIELVSDRDFYLGFTMQPGKTSPEDVLYVVKTDEEFVERIILNSDSGVYPSYPLAVVEAYEELVEDLEKTVAYRLVSLNALRFLEH